MSPVLKSPRVTQYGELAIDIDDLARDKVHVLTWAAIGTSPTRSSGSSSRIFMMAFAVTPATPWPTGSHPPLSNPKGPSVSSAKLLHKKPLRPDAERHRRKQISARAT
jgi:hypothetical protein